MTIKYVTDSGYEIIDESKHDGDEYLCGYIEKHTSYQSEIEKNSGAKEFNLEFEINFIMK